MELSRLVGRNIQRLRHKKNWSQEELSDASNLHRTYISQVERGVRNPTLSVLERIAGALGVHPIELLQEEAAN